MDPRFRPKGCARDPPIPANGLPYGHQARSHTMFGIQSWSGTRGESNGPCGATKRRATKRRFRPKGGSRNTPCNQQCRPKGVEKRDLLHQMGSDPVCFSIDPVLVKNIVAATPGAGRAPANGGRFSKNDPPHHVQGGRFGPPFSAKGCARDPPIPADGLPYGPTRVPIPCLASNRGPGRAVSPTDFAAPPNEGPRNGVFGQKGGSRNTPCNQQCRPKGVEKRDLLHQMGSDPVRFSIDPVLVINIVAATPGAGRAPANGGRFSKNDPPHHVQEGVGFGRGGPRFRPKGCARDPPIPANGLPYGHQARSHTMFGIQSVVRDAR